jgi:signal peptidase II
MTTPAREEVVDVRVGSSTNGLAPVSIAERSLGAGVRQWVGLGVIVGAALAGDQVTKYLVRSRLRLDESVHVLGPLEIHRVQNSGIAFGLFASATVVVTLATALAVGWMLAFFARSGARHPVLPAGLGLLIGGSIANLVDRVRLGHVTDFLDLGWWPAFNLADSFIVIGVCILLGALMVADRRP